MANKSCVDSEIFYKKLGEVKASKKTKASKITLFIDDNFYNDAVKWLETRNEDSKDRTNLTSQDVAIIKRKGWKLEGGKILSKNGKEIVQKCQLHQVLCKAHSNIAHKGRDKMEKYVKRNYESVSQEVIQLFGCVRLGNPDLDLKIWIFGFPIEHKIRKRISRRILLIEILTRHGFPISESATKSVFRFCVRLEI